MPYIKLNNVSLEYPLYNIENTSIKQNLLRIATGGRIALNSRKKTVIEALSDINLDIRNGERIGILGHNGAGKSTLLRCIAGIYKPTSGNIEHDGTVSALIEIGAGMEPELSGYDNIKRMLHIHGTQCKNQKTINKKIADFSELHDFLSLPVRTYSSGMLMRLMFSIATIEAPDILVMDEFFSVGDEYFQKKAEDRMRNHIDKTPILIFASHSKALLSKFCTHFLTLENGKVVRQDS